MAGRSFKPIVSARVAAILLAKPNEEGENAFGKVLAVYNTGERLPVRCGEFRGKHLCNPCAESIWANKEKLLKSDLNLIRLLGFESCYSEILMLKRMYHWKKYSL